MLKSQSRASDRYSKQLCTVFMLNSKDLAWGAIVVVGGAMVWEEEWSAKAGLKPTRCELGHMTASLNDSASLGMQTGHPRPCKLSTKRGNFNREGFDLESMSYSESVPPEI